MSVVKRPIKAAVFESDLGWIGLEWCGKALTKLTFGHPQKGGVLQTLGGSAVSEEGGLTNAQQQLSDRVLAFTEGAPEAFTDVCLDLSRCTDFQREVLTACRRIPYGETQSYADLAKTVGRPRAARAVGNTMAANPIPLVIPCHRVVSSADYDCGGFSAPGGVNMKKQLLELESMACTRSR